MRELTKEERAALNAMQHICKEWMEAPYWTRPSSDVLGKMIANYAAGLTYPPVERLEWTDEQILRFYANEGA